VIIQFSCNTDKYGVIEVSPEMEFSAFRKILAGLYEGGVREIVVGYPSGKSAPIWFVEEAGDVTYLDVYYSKQNKIIINTGFRDIDNASKYFEAVYKDYKGDYPIDWVFLVCDKRIKVGDLIDLCHIIHRNKVKMVIVKYHLEKDVDWAELYNKCEELKKDTQYVCKVHSYTIDPLKDKNKQWKLFCEIEGKYYFIYINSPTRDFYAPSWKIVGKSYYVTFLDEFTNPYLGRIQVELIKDYQGGFKRR
jgi:hypothetical protein